MKWSDKLHKRWMENCLLCLDYVEQESFSDERHNYVCTDSSCRTHFGLQLVHPSHERKHGVFICIITTNKGVLQRAMNELIQDKFFADCTVCGGALVEGSDKIFRCPGRCGVSVEFCFKVLPSPLVSLVVIMRVPEPGFSQILSRNLDRKDFN